MSEAYIPQKSESDHTRVAGTAWRVSYLRTFSDIPLSQEFFEALSNHLSDKDELRNGRSDNKDHLAPQLEARYKLVDKLIIEVGTPQVLELASGLSTHGINLTRMNPSLSYVEVDLPSVVNEKRMVMSEVGVEASPRLNIVEGNALIEADVRKATAGLDVAKPLIVVNEGLMRYLSFDEKTKLAKIVHSLLSEFGGVWITPDISLRQVIAREDAVASGNMQDLNQITGIDIDRNLFEDEQHAKDFFEGLGFSVERHSFLEVTERLISPEKLGMSAEEVRKLNEPCVVFVMKLA